MSNINLYNSNNKYAEVSDEKLIEKIRLGDSEAQNYLLEKYRNLVSMKANRFFFNRCRK